MDDCLLIVQLPTIPSTGVSADEEKNQIQFELERVRESYREQVSECAREKETNSSLENALRKLQEELLEKEKLLVSIQEENTNRMTREDLEEERLASEARDELVKLREMITEREAQIKLLEDSLQQQLTEQIKRDSELDVTLNEASQLRQANTVFTPRPA